MGRYVKDDGWRASPHYVSIHEVSLKKYRRAHGIYYRGRYSDKYKARDTARRDRKEPKSIKQRIIRRQFLKDIKNMTPCEDCGRNFPHYVMHFDHARGVKVANVSSLTGIKWESFYTELEKCDIVCANCHMIRTHERRQHKAARHIVKFVEEE